MNAKKISRKPEPLQATKKRHYPPGMSAINCEQLDNYRDKRSALVGMSDEEFSKAISMHTIKLS